MNTIINAFQDELYLAGAQVAPGLYRDVDTGREVQLDQKDRLPASLDGRVAAYICVEHTWTQHQTRRERDVAQTK